MSPPPAAGPRSGYFRASSLAAALACARSFGTGSVLVDLDNTAVPYGWESDPEAASALLADALPPAAGRVIIVTNSRNAHRLAVPQHLALVAGARKPFTGRARLERAGDGQPVSAVVGDRVWTDGMLARRFGIPFVHVVHPAVSGGRRGVAERIGRRLAQLVLGRTRPCPPV